MIELIAIMFGIVVAIAYVVYYYRYLAGDLRGKEMKFKLLGNESSYMYVLGFTLPIFFLDDRIQNIYMASIYTFVFIGMIVIDFIHGKKYPGEKDIKKLIFMLPLIILIIYIAL